MVIPQKSQNPIFFNIFVSHSHDVCQREMDLVCLKFYHYKCTQHIVPGRSGREQIDDAGDGGISNWFRRGIK